MAEIGWEISDPIATTGFVATLRGRNRQNALAWRTDIDALPIQEETALPYASLNQGCMHACGHDAHMAVALGIAKILFEQKDNLQRDIHIIFQPNEEGAPGIQLSGADQMCSENLLQRYQIAQMLALHCDPSLPAGTLATKSGAIWAANTRLVAHVTGLSAHAAYPERGRDALWAACEMISAIYAAKSRIKANNQVISVCKMQAGESFNVLCDKASFEGTLRGESQAQLKTLSDLIQSCIQGVAQYSGVNAIAEFYPGAEAVHNDPELTRTVQQIIQSQGYATLVNAEMSMASEDFSYFSRQIPCCYLMMGIRPKEMLEMPPLHSPHFFLDESCLHVAASTMANVLLHLAA